MYHYRLIDPTTGLIHFYFQTGTSVQEVKRRLLENPKLEVEYFNVRAEWVPIADGSNPRETAGLYLTEICSCEKVDWIYRFFLERQKRKMTILRSKDAPELLQC